MLCIFTIVCHLTSTKTIELSISFLVRWGLFVFSILLCCFWVGMYLYLLTLKFIVPLESESKFLFTYCVQIRGGGKRFLYWLLKIYTFKSLPCFPSFTISFHSAVLSAFKSSDSQFLRVKLVHFSLLFRSWLSPSW